MIEHFSGNRKKLECGIWGHREDFLRYISRVYQNRDNTGLSCEFEGYRREEEPEVVRVVCENDMQQLRKTCQGGRLLYRYYEGKNAAIESRPIEKSAGAASRTGGTSDQNGGDGCADGRFITGRQRYQNQKFLSSMDGQTAALIMLI